MRLIRKAEPTPAAPEPTVSETAATGNRKARPTPTRREAEAARMARLHPELDPKRAKQLDREARAAERMRVADAVEALPERQLARDVVDSRFNVGEFALPVMLLILAVFMIPPLFGLAEYTIYVMWAIIALLVLDYVLMWRKLKRLAAERLPGRSLRGLGMYSWNRQMSFRGWRRPAPRVRRGEAI